MRFWANLIGYQAVWFANVYAATRGHPWTGICLALLFVAIQWAVSPHKSSDLRLVALALALGIAIDGTLNLSGWLAYASAAPALLAPLWIVAMWMAFAMTFNHSFTFLQGRPAMAALLGAIGGPLAYLGAARGFGAVAFVEPAWRGLSLLAFGWAVALFVLARCARHGQRGAMSLATAAERNA